ncbi:hypothetical protein AAEK53_001721 [Klebsiella aerogenes]
MEWRNMGRRYDVWARHSLDAASSRSAGGEVMSKCNALLYAMVIGFGLAAGIRVYIAWESLINLAWSAIRG